MKEVIRSKQDMVSAMGIYLAEMRPWMDKAGVAQTALTITARWEILPMSWIREAWHWIGSIRLRELAKIGKVRSLLPEELWDKYENWGGFDDCQEMIMMVNSLKDLKRVVISNDRPNFFKKTRVKGVCKTKIREEKAKAKARDIRRLSRKGVTA